MLIARAALPNRVSALALLTLVMVGGRAGHAGAEVLDSGPAGFSVRTVVQVARPASAVYSAVTRIGEWWNGSHTWSGDAKNLSLEARPGGCLCEHLPGGGVQHMTVVYADQGKVLRLSGGLGPLQPMAVTGVWSWTFTEANGVTTIEATYVVGGYSKNGLAGLAAVVDQVTGEQVGRLKAYAER